MENKTHEIKCWNGFMMDVATGKKSFEVRRDDRNYQVGDTLLLKGWNNFFAEYTGGVIEAEVIYKLDGGAWGIEEGFCVLGIRIHNYNF